MMQELWLPVVGWEGLYEVSSLGRVRSVTRVVESLFNGTLGKRTFPSRVLSPHINPSGYATVRLYRQSFARTYPIHLLVAEAFIGPRPLGNDVRHGPQGKLVNTPNNLSYGTRAENLRDRDRDGTHQRGHQGPGAKLTLEQAREIKRLKGVEPSHVVGARYGISFSAVCMIWRGVTWIDA